MALARNLRGIESLIPPSQRPLVEEDPLTGGQNMDPSILKMLQQMLQNEFIASSGSYGGFTPRPTPPSVGINLPPAPPPTGAATPFSEYFPSELYESGTAITTTPPTSLSPDRVEGELGDLLSGGGGVQEYLPTGEGAQPPSKRQRIQQLKANVSALENQIRQIMRQIRELQGGGRPPKDIGGVTPLPLPPWMPPPGG